MSAAPSSASQAAIRVLTWLRAISSTSESPATDLDLVRNLLPTTPFGRGVTEILPPMPLNIGSFEGSLVRNPQDHTVWGVLYKDHPDCPERSRFTIAHELGHFVLHRELQSRFECDNSGVISGQFDGRNIEREANEFASNLLMPLDVLRQLLGDQRKVTLQLLSDIACAFQVSLEALCLRFIEATDQRAILVHWDQGFLKYQRPSRSARLTRARVRQTDSAQEPFDGTLAADAAVVQCFEGAECSAALWCNEERPHMKLREFKHTFAGQNRVLSLLLLESAEPRDWDDSWQGENESTTSDRLRGSGQVARPSRHDLRLG